MNSRRIYTLEILHDAPVVIVHPEPGRSVGDGIRTGMGDLVRLLDEARQPLFVVLDLRQVAVEPDSLVEAANRSASGRSPIMHHPAMRETIFVSTHILVKMAVRGMASEAFGCARARHFDSLDQALGYCREQMGLVRLGEEG